MRSGDVESVRSAIKGGARIDAPDGWGRTPMIVALQQGRQPVVELLVDAGASPAATDAWGRTPLLVATQMKNTAAVRLLIGKKSDVNAANKNDITPLISAAQTGNREAAALLLAAGAQPNLVDNLGWSALAWANARKDEPMAKLLVEHGAKAGGGARPATAGAAPQRKLSPALDAERIVRGNPAAPVTIFEYTDFQCPYCARGAKTVEEVLARYEGQVRLIVKHLPLPHLHPMAMSSALYFEALSLQSAARAWAFYDRLFADQRALSGGDAYLQELAGRLGADTERLAKDLRSELVRSRVAADLKESERFQFDGVPAFIVNGIAIEGAQPAEAFVEAIEPRAR